MSRKRRRADGTLRPAYRRSRARRSREKRRAWLANFAPFARERFFDHVDVPRAIFLAAFERETGLDRAEASATLERIAEERRWRKLRTLDRTVVGIAPPRQTSQSKEEG